jgi:hypothetical protein
MVHRLGTALWRTAFALFLLVVSLVVFHAPTSEPSLERFAVEICDVPNEHDVPFLSRQAPVNEQCQSSTKWTPRTPILIPIERNVFLTQLAPPAACSFFDPPILRSTLLENPTARGPPVAA